MNLVDILIILVLIMFGIIGSERGIIKQLITTIGFLIVVILSFYLMKPLGEFLSLHLPFFFGKTSALNIIFYQALAFILIAVILFGILSFFISVSNIIEKILKMTIVLGIPSKILGFIAGLVEGFIIIFLCLFILNQPSLKFKMVNESKGTKAILKHTPILSNIGKGMVKTINDIEEIKEASEKLDENALNLKYIDVMLEHKVVSKSYVRKLIDKDKIKVTGIDTILNKY